MNAFIALDVETANADCSSICQIGIAMFSDGQIINKWETLINPEEPFDYIQVSKHKITEEMIVGKPTFPDIYKQFRALIENNIVIHHMPFDKAAITKLVIKYDLEQINTTWLDSAKIVRRTWPEFSKKGYGLRNIASYLMIDFNHHDALEDAIAAGKVVIEAMKIKGISIEDWTLNVNHPISLNNIKSTTTKIEYIPNPNGALYGEIIVFTGTLFISKDEAKSIAASLGAEPKDNVTKDTTMLVVGSQDDYKLAGYSKSSKHRKAEDLILKGQDIKILTENDFKLLIE